MQAAEYTYLRTAEERMWWLRAVHFAVQRLLPSPTPDLRLLELGCGTGGLMSVLQRSGYKVTGLDYAREAVELSAARQAGPVLRASGNSLPFAANSFDLITCIDVLEIGSAIPQQLVDDAMRSLRPGGQAIFLMPAHQWLYSEHDRAVNSVRRFNLKQLRSLFSGQPAQILRGSYLFFLLFPLMALHKLSNKPAEGNSRSDVRLFPVYINEPLYWLSWLEIQWLRWGNLPIGSSVWVLVRKND